MNNESPKLPVIKRTINADGEVVLHGVIRCKLCQAPADKIGDYLYQCQANHLHRSPDGRAFFNLTEKRKV